MFKFNPEYSYVYVLYVHQSTLTINKDGYTSIKNGNYFVPTLNGSSSPNSICDNYFYGIFETSHLLMFYDDVPNYYRYPPSVRVCIGMCMYIVVLQCRTNSLTRSVWIGQLIM